MQSPDSTTAINSTAWYSCASSVVGHVRKLNEDAFLDAREKGLWVVADGMGGHSRGDRASQEIVGQLQSFKPTGHSQIDLQSILIHLEEANNFCRNVDDGQVMGSTVVLLYAVGSKGYIVWAGDSRIYRLRDGKMQQLTDDHSLVQELHRLGELSEEEAENHPSSNVITRAIGVSDDLDVQQRQVELHAGDRFLLCSDGLFKDVLKEEVSENMSVPSVEQSLEKMVHLALKRGGTDNVTGIVVQISNAFAQPHPAPLDTEETEADETIDKSALLSNSLEQQTHNNATEQQAS